MKIREVLLVMAAVVLLWFVAARQQDSLRKDLNRLGTNLCRESEKVDAVGKYGKLIDALIVDYEARKKENEARGDVSKALINAGTIQALRDARIVTEPADCSKPLLP